MSDIETSHHIPQGGWIRICNNNIKLQFIVISYQDGTEFRTILAINQEILIRIGSKQPEIQLFNWREDVKGYDTLPISELKSLH